MRALPSAALLALLLAAGVHSASSARSGSAVGCTRRIYVTFFVYSTFPPPRNTRCWSYERPPQNLGRWHICHWDRPTDGSGPNWIYDDTNPVHLPLSAEKANVARCAAGGGPLGYEAMYRKSGRWRRVAPARVRITRFYAETYSSEQAVDDYFAAWQANRGIGRPLINVGPASAGRTYAATYRACRAIGSGTYVGVYSSRPVTAANGKLTAIQKAFKDCTTR